MYKEFTFETFYLYVVGGCVLTMCNCHEVEAGGWSSVPGPDTVVSGGHGGWWHEVDQQLHCDTRPSHGGCQDTHQTSTLLPPTTTQSKINIYPLDLYYLPSSGLGVQN